MGKSIKMVGVRGTKGSIWEMNVFIILSCFIHMIDFFFLRNSLRVFLQCDSHVCKFFH